MKKILKKVTSVLLAVMLVIAGTATAPVKAAGNEVIVHVQDGSGWGTMNLYNWGDSGETAGAWPGAVMEKDSVDGWYKYTIKAESDLNLVFSKNGTPQSGDVKGISKDSGEIWIVIGGEGEANDMGVASYTAVLYTKAEEGWPVSSQVRDTTAAVETQDESPKTGDTAPIIPIAIVGAGALLVGIVTATRRKEVRQ